jgi:hypothetical protein
MPGTRTHSAALAAFLLTTGWALAAPPLTIIQDTLYKADGSRFEGVAQVEWKSFQTGDGSEVPQHQISIRIANGNLRTALAPTTNALKPVYYTVRFNSEGRTQFVEYWSVPPSSAPLRLNEVRTHAPIASPITTPPATIAVQDVAGLRTELDLRPARGAGWIPTRAAMVSSSGSIESVLGAPGDCVRVDGTSGPCGNSAGGYVDDEAPGGERNGANTTFTLGAQPQPATGLALFRNGLLLRQGVDYSVSGNVLAFAVAPKAGDALSAWYRTELSGPEVVNSETPSGVVDGANSIFALASAPLPAASVQLFRNGLLLKAGADYTISGPTITFVPASTPAPGDILQATYRK